jgi:hypothetical protein
MNLFYISAYAILLGAGLNAAGYLWLMVLVFRGSRFAGLCALVFPPLLIPFVVQNWPLTRPPAVVALIGQMTIVLGSLGLLASDGVPK